MGAVDRTLNANRKRRLLKRLDAALGRRSTPAKATPAQQERTARQRAGYADAKRSYDEVKTAILRLGGLRSTRDFARSEIPADLYRPRTGKSPDEMAQFLTSEGIHYDGDDALINDLHRRRDALRDAAAGRGRRHNPQIVCMDIERDSAGRFRRHRR